MLRYITNKPKLDVTEGSVDAGYGYTSHGDPNTNVDAVINLPLIADTLAVRGGDLQRQTRRLHQQRTGHVHASATRDLGITTRTTPRRQRARPNSPVINNNNMVAQRDQSGDLPGLRLSGL